ncbi:MAG: thiol-activated cytolysin family protein, partial [Candidatus Izemoplasmatales bacterium]|nr:thiol-activated cytolysin family protein [Candidatus Izemoplasmatales bacterium]
MFRRILLLMLLLGFSFTFAACTFSSTTDNTTIQQTTVSTSLPSSLTTQTPENPELIEINDYVSGLKQNAVYDSFSTDLTRARRVRSVGEEEASNLGGIITDVPLGYRASYQKITTDAGIADITFWGANSNYIFPGSLVKIATPDQSDVLVPIVGVRRAPYVISSGLEGASGIDYSTKNIQNGTLSEVRTAINDMMKGVLQEGAQLPFNLSTTLTEIKSADELSIALGVSVKVQPVVSVKNQFEFENQKRKTYAVLVLKQVYYTIEADYPIAQGATGFFAANETKARIQAAIKTGDVPAYVSSVSYGRIVIITIKTDYSMQEIENKLKVKVNKGPAEVGVSAELEIDNEDESMELNYFVLGGSIEDNQAVLSASSISEALAALNSKYDPKKTIGVPISYKVSHLSDGSLAKIGSSSEYYAKILEPIPVENLYFQEQHRFSQLQLGSSNVLLNATKYPNEAILFPVTYMIQGAQVQNFHESILKDSDGNTIAKISTVRGEDKFNHKYYLQVSDNLSHIGKEVSIIAKSGNEESILTFRIVKVPVSSVGWTVNTQSINTAPPGAEIDLEATVTPSNASYKNLTFEIKIGLSYAEIIERIHPTSGKVVGYILKISNAPNANGRTVVVVAKADGVESIELSITIQKIPVSSVEISNNRGTTSMSPGLEAQLFVQVNPRNATYQSAQFLAYHIISGSQYIELSQGGLLKINSNAIIGAEIILRAEVDGVFSDDYVITVIDTIAEMVDI